MAAADYDQDNDSGYQTVLFQMTLDKDGINYFELNRPEYSFYHTTENAVLLQDGMKCLIKNVEETSYNDSPLVVIKLNQLL